MDLYLDSVMGQSWDVMQASWHHGQQQALPSAQQFVSGHGSGYPVAVIVRCSEPSLQCAGCQTWQCYRSKPSPPCRSRSLADPQDCVLASGFLLLAAPSTSATGAFLEPEPVFQTCLVRITCILPGRSACEGLKKAWVSMLLAASAPQQ